MPIILKDIDWGQSECDLSIKLPLKGVSPSSVDILYTKKYIKANYPPYLYECLLYEEINDKESKVVIKGGQIVFSLRKTIKESWPFLQSQEQDDKQLFLTRKKEQLEYYSQKLNEEKEKNDKRSYDMKQMSIKAAMALDSDNINKIEACKEAERKNVANKLDQMRSENNSSTKSLFKEDKEKIVNNNNCRNNKTVPNKENCPIRNFGKITMSFTPRYFPTPSRESTAADEEEWLKKREQNLRITSKEKDLDAEEINPATMKEKANNFFKNGDFDSAINAYSHTIGLSPGMPSLYSNRAACYLKKKMYNECIDDCNKAIELLTPPVDENKSSRIKAYVRLGTAYLYLNDKQKAILNLENALAIDRNNTQLLNDINTLKSRI